MSLKKKTLIQNLLFREDKKYLAVRQLKGSDAEFYFENINKQGKAATKELLETLEKDELYDLCFKQNYLLPKSNLNLKNFNLDTYKPPVRKENFVAVVKKDYVDKNSQLKNKLDLSLDGEKSKPVKKVFRKKPFQNTKK